MDGTKQPAPPANGVIATGMARCSNCGAIGYPRDKFCAGCGTPLVRSCPACAAVILQPVAFHCTQCGAALADLRDGEEIRRE